MEWIDYLVAGLQCFISVGGALLALFTYVRNGRMKSVQNETNEEVKVLRSTLIPKPQVYTIKVFDPDGKLVSTKEVKQNELSQKDAGTEGQESV